MPIIRTIQETPGGGSELVEREYTGRDVVLVFGDKRYTAALVTEVEMTEDQEVNSLTDDCGRTEALPFASHNADVNITGVCVETEESYQTSGKTVVSLSHEVVKKMSGNIIRLESPLESGEYSVKSYSLVDTQDIVEVNLGDGWKYAFEFQLQLKKPE